MTPTSPETPPKWSNSSCKRVSWADLQGVPAEKEDPMSIETRTKLVSSMTLEDGTCTFALHRSMRLLDSLYDIRRVSRPNSPPKVVAADPAAAGAIGEEAGDIPPAQLESP